MKFTRPSMHCFYTADIMVESSGELAVAGKSAPSGDKDKGKREGEGSEEGGETEATETVSSSIGSVSVHVEAVVGSMELLLYSGGGDVAEVNVRGQSSWCVDQ